MILVSPGEIAFSILGLPIYWYGLTMAIAVFVGVVTAEIISKKYYPVIPNDFFIDNSPIMIICGMLGARLYYCLLNFSYYFNNPYQILNIRQGGLSIHGMILAGIITAYFVTKKNKLNLLSVLDVLACVTPLAQAIGRWGNFFNSEAFGTPTNGTWGVFIPLLNRPEVYKTYELFHPTFLYESILNLFVFFTLLFIVKRTKCTGVVFCSYLICYAIVRFFVEFIRTDSVLYVWDLPIAQLISIIILITGLVTLYFIRKVNN